MTIVPDRSMCRPSGASLPNPMRMTSGGRRSVVTAPDVVLAPRVSAGWRPHELRGQALADAIPESFLARADEVRARPGFVLGPVDIPP